MKITRQKHAKKHLGFFRNNFGVREPYQILLDGTFCHAALRGRIQLREQLPRYLMGETQLCTTRWAGPSWAEPSPWRGGVRRVRLRRGRCSRASIASPRVEGARPRGVDRRVVVVVACGGQGCSSHVGRKYSAFNSHVSFAWGIRPS